MRHHRTQWLGEIAVYGESAGDSLAVYVRDRGAGFDLASVPFDRRGVRSSIVERVQGLGGEATLRSSAGSGTEWRLQVPIERVESDVG